MILTIDLPWILDVAREASHDDPAPIDPHTAHVSSPTRLAHGATGTAHAEYGPGEVPTGGGGLGNPAVDFNQSFPTATGWTMRATNHGSTPLDRSPG